MEASDTAVATPATPPTPSPQPSPEVHATAPGGYKVIRRNGKVTPFDASKIKVALTKAFLAVEGGSAAESKRVHDTVAKLTEQVAQSVTRNLAGGGTVHIEDIQDQVELALMRAGEHKVARDYVLYRDRQAAKRAEKAAESTAVQEAPELRVRLADGSLQPLDAARIHQLAVEACEGIPGVDPEKVTHDTLRNLYDEISESDLAQAPTLAARALIETEPSYSTVAARLLLDKMRHEALIKVSMGTHYATHSEMRELYPSYFVSYVKHAVEWELLDEELLQFDLKKLGSALDADRDNQFNYLGLQTLYDRYFLHQDEDRFELPQAFFMRVAMGLAINEVDRNDRAIEFYRLLSSFDFMSSTPTLFNSGTPRPQLSSCYLTTVPDDLHGIFGAIHDNAMLSKFAGGLGNDWTPVRSMGAYIKGTNGKSQGVVPFLKVANDTAVAVNQGGKRKGAVCAYLETWHRDIEEFVELRKNTGDERRRTHDMNTANWVPDLFMQRVLEEGPWTLFSPNDVPDLHDLTGAAFEKAYVAYEEKADRGEIKNFKRLPAVQLWRKMLGQLFETGHPWITFKDPCNLRSPQQHVGVVHSSNLCTEITLNTSADKEIAVCNLGSVNLAQHVVTGPDGQPQLDREKLEKTISTAMRMLDNVIEYNYYSVPTARASNLRHRPVGLGVMGFQDALYKMGMAYESDAAVDFADESMELISYNAIKASSELAAERGCYKSFPGSLWSQGILPIDSIENLAAARKEGHLKQDRTQRLDWDSLREQVKTVGMRNSNTMAIAPTATIANITGVSQSIEPTYQNLFVKSNLSGDFTVINPYLVDQLKERGLWDQVMVHDLKFYDGSVQQIDRVPDDIKAIFRCAFEVDPHWLIKAASRRQKWLDQAQSLNLYMREPSGRKLDELYKDAWLSGLKTTYYLRSMGATHSEKTTIEDSRLNRVSGGDDGSRGNSLNAAASPGPQAASPAAVAPEPMPKACSILDPDCDACQ